MIRAHIAHGAQDISRVPLSGGGHAMRECRVECRVERGAESLVAEDEPPAVPAFPHGARWKPHILRHPAARRPACRLWHL